MAVVLSGAGRYFSELWVWALLPGLVRYLVPAASALHATSSVYPFMSWRLNSIFDRRKELPRVHFYISAKGESCLALFTSRQGRRCSIEEHPASRLGSSG